MRAAFRSLGAVLVCAATATIALAGDQMPWQPNLEAAQRAAAQSNRLVLIHFWAPWCRPCVRLEQEVFSNAQTAKALEANFVLVKLNADETPATARMYGVSSLPSDVITTPTGRLVSQMQSPPTANQYITQMNQAAAGHRALARKPDPQSAQQMVPPQAPGVPPANYGAAYAPQDPYAAPPQTAAAPYASPNDRYAEYFPENQNPATNPQPVQSQPYAEVTPAQAYAAVPPGGPNPVDPYAAPSSTAPPPAVQPPLVDPYAAGQAVAPPQTAPYPGLAQAPPQPYSAQESYQPPKVLPQLPPGCPPAGLDGNCPVTLVERKRWVIGHPAYGVVHRGRTYLFLGPQEKDRFLADPDRYSPVLSGVDPVLALDNRTAVPGRREFGVFGADGRVYLFADESSRARFEQNERHYAAQAVHATQSPQYQAMRPQGR